MSSKKPLPRQPASDSNLLDEITMLRDAIRRIFALAAASQEPAETLRLLETLGATSVRLSRLLKVQHELGQDQDEVAQAISAALDDILKDWERS
jgi:hypothetical protein